MQTLPWPFTKTETFRISTDILFVLPPLQNNKFDAIICLQVIKHIRDQDMQWLKQLFEHTSTKFVLIGDFDHAIKQKQEKMLGKTKATTIKRFLIYFRFYKKKKEERPAGQFVFRHFGATWLIWGSIVTTGRPTTRFDAGRWGQPLLSRFAIFDFGEVWEKN